MLGGYLAFIYFRVLYRIMNKKEKRTYQFRLYPSKQQELILLENLELCRFTYNILLQELNNQKIKDKSQIQGIIPDLKICNPNLKKAYAKTLQFEIDKLFSNLQSLSNLKRNGKKVGSLRFKSKNSFKSITYNQKGFKFFKTSSKRMQKLYLSKIGKIPIRAHKELNGKIKQITIKKTCSKKWFANIVCEVEKKTERNIENKQIGIDLGLINYAYDSEGNHFDNPKILNKSLRILKRKQKKFSKKQKSSRNREKQKIQLAKLHEKIINQRNDFIHKLSRYYVNNYSLIVVEDLKFQNLIQNNKLSIHIIDSSWAKFIQMLEYKAESAGVQIIKVNPRGTTQKCSNCDNIVPKKLSDREHNCKKCGLQIPRDYNSAINIKKYATVGSTEGKALGNVSREMFMNQESCRN